MVKRKNKDSNPFNSFNLSQSYVSLLLGIVVVIVAAVLITSLVKNRNERGMEIKQEQVPFEQTKKTTQPETYTVVLGDTLKIISLKVFNTQDYFDDIAQMNNLTNPDLIEVGMVLKLPKVDAPAMESGKIDGTTYTVGQNETLWNIAVRAYGDGFRWTEIANANGFSNPDRVEPGTVLKIPRQ